MGLVRSDIVADYEARLGLVDGDRSALSWLLPELHRELGTYGAGTYCMHRHGTTLRLSAGTFLGDRCNDLRAAFDDWLATSRASAWCLYDPFRVVSVQRNRLIIAHRRPSEMLPGRLPRWADRRLAERALHQNLAFLQGVGWDAPTARILVCDGPRMLAYVGFNAEERFDRSKLSILRALAPAIVRRLRLEHVLDGEALGAGAIDVVVEAIPRAAFIVGARGAILHANALARAWFEHDRAGVLAALCSRSGPDGHVFEVHQLGTSRAWLAICRPTRRDLSPQLAAVTRSFGLTRREAEVLAILAYGATNARIAAELECAEATIEIHVSRLLDKVGVENRAALVAAVWTIET